MTEGGTVCYDTDELIVVSPPSTEAFMKRVLLEEIASLQAQVAVLSPLATVATLGDYLTIDTTSNSILFTGANLYVQSGSGATDGAVNGLGNLIVGYNEASDETRVGSHNLVLGA